ncbi:hypothetical protein ABZ208_30780 [Streptomyces sp. NPDC006208]|uniref:nSTAND1 domain-containing NTPase n=1 Tax=Streptomyces sp. NPDC006208 TaxID=3156734 RepID=UPI0033B0713E
MPAARAVRIPARPRARHDPAERVRFIDLLLTARQPQSRLRVLLAVRADFYGRCAEHRDLPLDH